MSGDRPANWNSFLQRDRDETLRDQLIRIIRERDAARATDKRTKDYYLAAVAAAYRIAAEHMHCKCSPDCTATVNSWRSLLELTPADAIRAEKRLVAQAVLDEVESIATGTVVADHGVLVNWLGRRIEELKAALAAIEETNDAT